MLGTSVKKFLVVILMVCFGFSGNSVAELVERTLVNADVIQVFTNQKSAFVLADLVLTSGRSGPTVLWLPDYSESVAFIVNDDEAPIQSPPQSSLTMSVGLSPFVKEMNLPFANGKGLLTKPSGVDALYLSRQPQKMDGTDTPIRFGAHDRDGSAASIYKQIRRSLTPGSTKIYSQGLPSETAVYTLTFEGKTPSGQRQNIMFVLEMVKGRLDGVAVLYQKGITAAEKVTYDPYFQEYQIGFKGIGAIEFDSTVPVMTETLPQIGSPDAEVLSGVAKGDFKFNGVVYFPVKDATKAIGEFRVATQTNGSSDSFARAIKSMGDFFSTRAGRVPIESVLTVKWDPLMNFPDTVSCDSSLLLPLLPPAPSHWRHGIFSHGIPNVP